MIKQSPAKTKSFLKAINRAAMQKCDDISKQIEETTAAAMKQAEEEASRDGHHRIDSARAKIEANAKMLVSEYEKAKKSEICKKRLDYQNQVFEEAENKLISFTKTDEYKDFLKKSANEVSDIVGKNLTVFISPEDKIASQIIKSIFPDCQIEEDALIKIGGAKFKNNDKNIAADCTLDSKLQSELDWFLLNSKLKVEL